MAHRTATVFNKQVLLKLPFNLPKHFKVDNLYKQEDAQGHATKAAGHTSVCSKNQARSSMCLLEVVGHVMIAACVEAELQVLATVCIC